MAEKTPPKTDAPDTAKSNGDAAGAASSSVPKTAAGATKPATENAKPTDKPSEKPADKPAVKPADKPASAKPSASSPKPSAAKPSAPSTQPSQPRKRGGFGRFVLWVVILIAVAAGGAAASFDYWWPQMEPRIAALLPSSERADPLTDQRFTALVERVDALESSVAEADAAGASASADAIADLNVQREALSADLADALGRLAAVEKAVSDVRDLAQAVAPGDGTSIAADSLARINERLSQLEGSNASVDTLLGRIEKLESADVSGPDPEAVSAAIQGLETRIGALESDMPAMRPADGSALLVALGDLRAAVRTGRPFADELAATEAAAGDVLAEEAVATLRTHAADGVPTLGALRERFQTAAVEIARARIDPAADDWMSKIVSQVSSLVSVRRIDGAGADTIDGRLARAEQALAASDLAGAVGAVEGLEGAAADAATGWLAEARARLDSERALSVLNVRAISILRDG